MAGQVTAAATGVYFLISLLVAVRPASRVAARLWLGLGAVWVAAGWVVYFR